MKYRAVMQDRMRSGNRFTDFIQADSREQAIRKLIRCWLRFGFKVRNLKKENS